MRGASGGEWGHWGAFYRVYTVYVNVIVCRILSESVDTHSKHEFDRGTNYLTTLRL